MATYQQLLKYKEAHKVYMERYIMPLKFVLLITCIILLTPGQVVTRKGLGHNSYPDVINCSNYFYYLSYSSPTFSRYNALTTNQVSYQARDGVLVSKVGGLSSNCENNTIESLWENKRAFRILNIKGLPNDSIFNQQNLPDVIKCGEDILFFDYRYLGIMYYRNINGGYVLYSEFGFLAQKPREQKDVNCQNSSINQLVTNRQAFNIATQELQNEDSSIYSMTKKYPDALRCKRDAVIYIYWISNDKRTVLYRDITGDFQLRFKNNGQVGQTFGAWPQPIYNRYNSCIHRSISQLIKQGMALNFNTPQPKCPKDMKVQNPLVSFKVDAPPGFTVTSKPQSGTFFPRGKTTKVSVKIKHFKGQIFFCSFNVDVADTLPPDLTCPQNISQTYPKVSYQAKAVSNSPTSVQISYDKAPGSKFPFGKTTVRVVATDGYRLQTECQFTVEINYFADVLASAERELSSQWVTRLIVSMILGLIIGLGSVLMICCITQISCRKCKKETFPLSRQNSAKALKDDLDSARKFGQKESKSKSKKANNEVSIKVEGTKGNFASIVEDIE